MFGYKQNFFKWFIPVVVCVFLFIIYQKSLINYNLILINLLNRFKYFNFDWICKFVYLMKHFSNKLANWTTVKFITNKFNVTAFYLALLFYFLLKFCLVINNNILLFINFFDCTKQFPLRSELLTIKLSR